MSSKIPVAISFTGLANLLGVVGVIGSLIFVGLELRQSQRIALAGTATSREPGKFLQFTRLRPVNLVRGLPIRGDGTHANYGKTWFSKRGSSAEPNINLGANAAFQLWMRYENDHSSA